MKKSLVLFLALFSILFANAQGQSEQKTTPKKPLATEAIAAEEAPVKIEKVAAEPGKEVVAVYHFTSARDYSYDYAVGVGNAVEGGFVRSRLFK